MQTATEQTKRRVPSGLLSLVLHLCILTLVLIAGNVKRTPRVQPLSFQPMALIEVAGVSHTINMPLPPAEIAARTRKPTPDTVVSQKTILPIPQPRPVLAGGGAPQDPRAGNGSGQALFGNGADAQDAHPSFPTYSPKPPVHDRSLLPATEKKIVVDVDIDAQ